MARDPCVAPGVADTRRGVLAISTGGLIALIAAGLAAFGVAAYYSHKREQERIRALRGVAQRLGWEFSVHKNRRHRFCFEFDVFAKGEDQYAYNTLQGQMACGRWRLQAQAGDYHYTVSRRDSQGRRRRSTHRFSYLVLRLPVVDTHTLYIRPEGFLDKVASSLGFDDIDFESAEFSGKFFVKSSDKRFAYDVIHPRMMEFLLAEKPSALEFARGKFCLAEGSRRWEAAEFSRHLRFAKLFFELWPEHIVTELGGTHDTELGGTFD